MWRYGRAFPRKISVKDAAEMWRQRVQDSKHWDVLALKCSRLAEGSWLNKTEGTIVNDIVYNIVYYIVHIRYRVHIPFMILQVHIVCDTVCFPVIIGSLQTGGRERGLTARFCLPHPFAIPSSLFVFVHCFVPPHVPLKHVQHSFPVTPRPMIYICVTTIFSADHLSDPIYDDSTSIVATLHAQTGSTDS